MWGRSLTGMGPTVPRGRTRKEAGPSVPRGKNCEVGKKLGRCGSHFATRDEFACSEIACQDWVPLYHKGESGEEAGPIVPVGKNS